MVSTHSCVTRGRSIVVGSFNHLCRVVNEVTQTLEKLSISPTPCARSVRDVTLYQRESYRRYNTRSFAWVLTRRIGTPIRCSRDRQFYVVYSQIWESLTPELRSLSSDIRLPILGTRDSTTPDIDNRLLVSNYQLESSSREETKRFVEAQDQRAQMIVQMLAREPPPRRSSRSAAADARNRLDCSYACGCPRHSQ
jgi:hypothetical protein